MGLMYAYSIGRKGNGLEQQKISGTGFRDRVAE
jgi:hypothetical protein